MFWFRCIQQHIKYILYHIHPYIPSVYVFVRCMYYDVIFSFIFLSVFENKDKIVIIMEYASKGELYDYISERRRLSERETRHFFRQIVSAVHYCHKVSGVHTWRLCICSLAAGMVVLDKNRHTGDLTRILEHEVMQLYDIYHIAPYLQCTIFSLVSFSLPRWSVEHCLLHTTVTL